MFQIMPSTRLRPTPFHDCTIEDGVTHATIYNNMILPTGYGDPKGEYDNLMNGVTMWDVAVERQIQLKGPDAGQLAQILSPRDLSKCVPNQGKYVALCNHQGTLINDPILLKHDDDLFWFSIADSNILFWARAIAAERGLNVEITEPDVSPLAIQGPKSGDVGAAIFGDWVRDLKYFWFNRTEIDGIPVAVQRSGWSKQSGFEIYLMDGSRGRDLWNIVKEAGKPFDIGPGYPNSIERIESGLLSYGGDTDDTTNPFEVRLGGYVDTEIDADVIGQDALRKIKAEGPKRHQLGVVLDGDQALAPLIKWADISKGGQFIGSMTNSIWSYKMDAMIGFGLVDINAAIGDEVEVKYGNQTIGAKLVDIPFNPS